jgi:CheY-like chemotaxis protein
VNSKTNLSHPNDHASCGYTVLTAKDGIEAMEIFAWHQDEIRCVVSDLAMPRMNGWEIPVALR